jgi:hypothetical protein
MVDRRKVLSALREEEVGVAGEVHVLGGRESGVRDQGVSGMRS